MPRLINNKEQRRVEKTDVTEINKKSGEKRVIVEEGEEEKERKKRGKCKCIRIFISSYFCYTISFFFFFFVNPHCAFKKKRKKEINCDSIDIERIDRFFIIKKFHYKKFNLICVIYTYFYK